MSLCRNYCSVGVMDLCLIKFVDIDWLFLCNSCPYVLFESLSHVINQESHVYLWNLGTFIFLNFEISLVSLWRFQNFKKVNSVNLSYIPLLNMWSLVQITLDDSLEQCLATSRGEIHKKIWGPRFGPNRPKSKPRLGFSSFSQNCMGW